MSPSRRRPALMGLGLTGSAMMRLVTRRFKAEWRTTPFYAMTINHPRPTGLAVGPSDFRPVDPDIGRQVLLGRFALAGATLETGLRGEPWDVPSPTRAFAVEMHRFTWLPSLILEGPDGVEEGLRLVLDWERTFRSVTPFLWGAETLERRVFNLACAVRPLSERASEFESASLTRCLARQARHLLRLDETQLRCCERYAVSALAGVCLAGAAGDRLSRSAISKLSKALTAEVLADGGPKSRRPEQALELLFDLLTLDDALLLRGREAPEALSRAIDRLTQSVRFFTLGDGRLASFQGGEAASAKRVNAALAHDDAEGRTFGYLPHSGYQRMAGRGLVVIVDAAPEAEGDWSLAACAQPLAMEITCGGDRLISNTGWSPDAQGTQAFRLTGGGSTASVGEASAGRVLRGFQAKGLGPRLVGGASRVDVVRNENEHGVWLEMTHDGWAEGFGFSHERRLFLDASSDELRGEDRFEPVAGAGQALRRSHGYAVRFHLPPQVQVSIARDKRSVLLRGPSNRGWWFRNDAQDVLLETSTIFEDRLPHRGSQVVLKGPMVIGEGARVRWKLTPVEPADAKGGRQNPVEDQTASFDQTPQPPRL